MSQKFLLNIRKWLNPAGSSHSGYIVARVSNDDGYRYASLKIADCSRIINLSIDTDGKKERRASVRKLNILIDTLVKLRNAVEAWDK